MKRSAIMRSSSLPAPLLVSDDGMPVMNSPHDAPGHGACKSIEPSGHFPFRRHSSGRRRRHERGETSRLMAVAGIPNAAETIGVMRDIALAELTGARLHIAHVSTAGSVRAIREAKGRGVRVTAENRTPLFLPHGRRCPEVRDECENESTLAVGPRSGCDSPRPGRRNHRCHRHRPCAPRTLGKGSGFRRCAERHHRPGNFPAVSLKLLRISCFPWPN